MRVVVVVVVWIGDPREGGWHYLYGAKFAAIIDVRPVTSIS
jgi:hypothetical protein